MGLDEHMDREDQLLPVVNNKYMYLENTIFTTAILYFVE